MASVFTKIIRGEIPSYKVADNDEFYAFLDISPLAKGHTLIVPKVEVDYIFDIDDEVLGRMMIFSKQVGKAIESVIPCLRIGIAVIGLEVPHSHIHLVPINSMGDLNFSNPKLDLSAEEFSSIAERIHDAFNKLT